MKSGAIDTLPSPRPRLAGALLPFLIAASPLLFFRAALFEDKAAIIWDAFTQFYAIWEAEAQAFHSGHILLWLPSLLSGFPIVGDPQGQLFYLFNLPFFLYGHFSPYLLYCQIVLHISLAGVGTYFLARHLKLGTTASALSACSYMYCGFMIGHFSHPQMVAAAAWLPLVMLAFSRLMDRAGLGRIALAGLSLAGAFFSGHPPTAFYIVLLIALFVCWQTLLILWPRHAVTAAAARPLSALAALILALLLYGIQLLPALDLWRLSERSRPRTLQEGIEGGMWFVQELIALIHPNHFNAASGVYWGSYELTQHYMYAGVAAFILSCFGVVASFAAANRRTWPFFAIGAAGSLAFVMGSETALYPLLFERFPLIRLFRAPAYSSFTFFFCLAMLAGFGWDSLVEASRKRSPFKILFPLLGAGLLLLLLLRTIPGGHFEKLPWRKQLSAESEAAFVETAARTAKPAWVPHMFPAPLPLDSTARLGLRLCIALALINLIYFLRKPMPAWGCLSVALVFLDLFVAGSQARQTGYGSKGELPADSLALEKKLAESSNEASLEGRPFRTWVEGWKLQGNVPIRSGIQLASGINPLSTARHRALHENFQASERERYFQLNNVRFVLEHEELREVPQFLPRAYFAPCVEGVADEREALARLAVGAPGRTVVKDSGAGQAYCSENPVTPLAVHYGPNRITVESESPLSGTVVLLESYNRGWRARAGSQELPVAQANYDFMAVRLKEPASKIEFSFEPASLYWGVLCTALGLFSCLAMFIAGVYRSAPPHADKARQDSSGNLNPV